METADGLSCAPWLDDVAPECEGATAAIPGEPECVPLGPPCPAGPFPDDPPVDAVVLYVEDGATGGDGTRAAPFGRIADAMGMARAATTIQLAKGAYEEPLRVRAGVTVQGACVAETTLTGTPSSASDTAIIYVATPDVRVRDLRITSASLPGVWAQGAGATILLEDVLIERVPLAGIVGLRGAHIEARNLAVRDAVPSGGRGGRLVSLQEGATAEIVRASLLRAFEGGVTAVDDGTQVRLVSARVSGSAISGVSVEVGSNVELVGCVVDTNRQFGVYGYGEGTVVVDHTLVHHTLGEGPPGTGPGLGVTQGGRATVRAGRFEQNVSAGVVVTTDADLDAEDLVIRDTMPRGTQEVPGDHGSGLVVDTNGRVDVTRGYLERNNVEGVRIRTTGAALSARDLTVRETRVRVSQGDYGFGLAAMHGALLTVERASFELNRTAGVAIDGTDTSASLTDIRIEGTEGDEALGLHGNALGVQNGATADLTRADFIDSQDASVIVMDSGAALEAADLRVQRTRERRCAPDLCPTFPSGMGMRVVDASAVLERFALSESPMCGLQLGAGAQIDLHDGVVEGAAIGACIQVDGYELSRLSDRVVYRDNGVNLQATTLPTPEPASPAMLP